MKPDDGYISYIINPSSGASSGKLLASRFKQYLVDKGFDIRVGMTESLEHAGRLAADSAVDYNCAMVVCAGGDGTVREVAHGLEGSDKPLLIVPSGTENLVANELGFDAKLKTLVDTFDVAFTRFFDLGKINGRCFAAVAGFGFDGEIVKQVSEKRNGHIDHFDYAWPIWHTFWRHQFPSMRVEVDSQEIFNGRGLVFVGNISRYAVGMQLLHDADFSDGLLDICIYKCSSKIRLVKHSVMTVLKRHTSCGDVIYRQGKNVTITSNEGYIDSEVDGDPGGGLPAKIEIIPQAVKVMVPRNAKPAGIRTRIIRAIG